MVNTVVVKCPICGRPFVVVPDIRGSSNACLSCTKRAKENSGLQKGWEHSQ